MYNKNASLFNCTEKNECVMDLTFNHVYSMFIVNMTWMCNNLQHREIN